MTRHASNRPGFRAAAAASNAIDHPELDPPIERIALVVGAQSDQRFARADTGGAESRGQRAVVLFEHLLHGLGALARQRLVGARAAGAAGVAADARAGARLAGFLRQRRA